MDDLERAAIEIVRARKSRPAESAAAPPNGDIVGELYNLVRRSAADRQASIESLGTVFSAVTPAIEAMREECRLLRESVAETMEFMAGLAASAAEERRRMAEEHKDLQACYAKDRETILARYQDLLPAPIYVTVSPEITRDAIVSALAGLPPGLIQVPVQVTVPQAQPPAIEVRVPDAPPPVVNVTLPPPPEIAVQRDNRGRITGLRTVRD